MGTMGSGKTTAARLIAKELGFHLLEENFSDNIFLSRFYNDMKRWAFHSQTFFLTEKLRQIMSIPKIISRRPIVQDTPIQQDVYSYAQAQLTLGNMTDDEWKLYLQTYTLFEPYLPVPDLIIYLEAALPVLKNRIAKRSRSYERMIPEEYLRLLDKLNRVWMTKNKNIPIQKVNTDGFDFNNDKSAKKSFLKIIRKNIYNLNVRLSAIR